MKPPPATSARETPSRLVEFRRQLLGDLARLAPDLLGEVEGEGQGHVAQIELRRGLNEDLVEGDAESLRHGLADARRKFRLEGEDH